jgi:hypothetical protein
MLAEKLFHRQVNPNFIANNVVSVQAFNPAITSQVFKLKTADKGLLSVYNNTGFSPEAAYTHFKGLGFDSVGTVSVSSTECSGMTLNVLEDNNPFPGHASIDMTKEGSTSAEKKAKLLKRFATKRGWTHGPITL